MKSLAKLLVIISACVVFVLFVGCSEQRVKPANNEEVRVEAETSNQVQPEKQRESLKLDKTCKMSSLSYSVSSKWQTRYIGSARQAYYTSSGEFDVRRINENPISLSKSDLEDYFETQRIDIPSEQGVTISASESFELNGLPAYHITAYSKKDHQYDFYYVCSEYGTYRLMVFNGDDEWSEQAKDILYSFSFGPSFCAEQSRVNSYKSAIGSHDFDAAISVVNDYVSLNPNDDNAKRLSELTVQLRDLMSSCTYVSDDIEKKEYAYYSGNTEITESNHVVVYLKYNQTELNACNPCVVFGFIKNDWLFFEGIKIAFDGSNDLFEQSWKSYRMTRDVLDGGTVKESSPGGTLYGLNSELLDKYSPTIVRFYNDNNETMDVELSSSEREALVNSRKAGALYKEIYDQYL